MARSTSSWECSDEDSVVCVDSVIGDKRRNETPSLQTELLYRERRAASSRESQRRRNRLRHSNGSGLPNLGGAGGFACQLTELRAYAVAERFAVDSLPGELGLRGLHH